MSWDIFRSAVLTELLTLSVAIASMMAWTHAKCALACFLNLVKDISVVSVPGGDAIEKCMRPEAIETTDVV